MRLYRLEDSESHRFADERPQPVIMISSGNKDFRTAVLQQCQVVEHVMVVGWDGAFVFEPEVENVTHKVKSFRSLNIFEKTEKQSSFSSFQIPGFVIFKMGVGYEKNCIIQERLPL
jgi:hypothetical protein